MAFLRQPILQLAFAATLAGSLLAQEAAAATKKQSRKATEDEDEVVKNKLFPKKTKFEIAGPDLGLILNQSYVDSYVLHGDVVYYFSEDWGLSLEGLYAINSDKSERDCIESFYNDPNQNVGAACSSYGEDPLEPLIDSMNTDGTYNYKPAAGFGPAYVGIREISAIINAAAIWTPVYGKSLVFLKDTIHFDLFMSMGIGMTMSTYYPKSLFLKNGKLARPRDLDKDQVDALTQCDESVLGGACPQDPNYLSYIGVAGRPDALQETSPTITIGVGQKFHFKQRFHLKAEIRSYTLVGTEAGYDSFFMLWTGLGMRL